MNEIWIQIKNYEGIYEISNMGKVKSCPNNKYKKLKILKPQNQKGYFAVALWKNSKSKWHLIHRLVAEAFIPNPYNLPEIHHKNHIKSDNQSENLEWITHKNNIIQTFKDNKYPVNKLRGENNGGSKLTELDIFNIRKLHKEQKLNYIEIGKLFNVDSTNIGCIIRGITWRHI